MSSSRSCAIVLVLAVLTTGWLAPRAAQADQLDSDIRLFTVLTAVNLAGYDDGLGSPSDSPVRRAIRDELKDFQGSSLALLKNFYEQNKLSDPGQNLSQYVSFALVCEGPPRFEVRAELPTDLPPDVRRLRGLGPILAEFYQQAPIEQLWSKYQPAFEAEIVRYQEPLIQSLFEAGGYLRVSPTSRQVQSFQVVFDLLAAANNVNTRGYKGNVYVVVHPAKQLRVDEIRHAFLLHLLDPLAVRYADEIGKKDVLSRFALFAPALDEIYKSDFQLLVTKCLVKAVEARLSRKPEQELPAQVERDLREGYILTPYFYEALGEYEKQGQEMRLYYPEMVKGIDLKREAARLQTVTFTEAPARPKAQPQTVRPQFSDTDLLLREAEVLLRSEKLSEARKKFEEALEKSSGRNADASYGLARVAISEGEADLGRQLFSQALESNPDPYVESMAHVYMGRIADIMGMRQQAEEHYRLALAVQGIPEKARQLAKEGLSQAFGSPRQRQAREQENEEPEQNDKPPL